MTSILTDEEYQYIESKILKTARQRAIARKIVPKGPTIGFGKETIKYYPLTEMSDATVSLEWGADFTEDKAPVTGTTLNVPVLHKNFRLNRRHVESARTEGRALDLTQVDAAIYKVMLQEEAMLLNGWTADGTNYDISGLYQSAGNTYDGSTVWTTNELQIQDDITAGIALLLADNIFPPYNLVVHPQEYTPLTKVISSTSDSWIEWVRRVIQGDVYVSPSMTSGTGMLCAAGNSGFFDYVTGVDMTSKVEELNLDQGNDYYGVVYECIVPRVIESNAICSLTDIH